MGGSKPRAGLFASTVEAIAFSEVEVPPIRFGYTVYQMKVVEEGGGVNKSTTVSHLGDGE